MVTFYNGIGCMTVSAFGVVGNIMSIVVLYGKSMGSSTYSYLRALSVYDTLFLLATMFLVSEDVHRPQIDDQLHWGRWSNAYYPYMFPCVHALAFTFQVTSIWITLAFTVDRYIMICHPFTGERFCTVSRARKVIASLCVLSILCNIPKFAEYKWVSFPVAGLNTTVTVLDLTDFGRSWSFKLVHHNIFYLTFVCGIPFIALAILNICLILAVRESRRRAREISSSDPGRNDTTVMLISVVIVFFICQAPALVSRILWATLSEDFLLDSFGLYVLQEVATFLVTLNSAVNILPYYFFGTKFRREFLLKFCRCLLSKARRQSAYSMTQSHFEPRNSRSQSTTMSLLHSNSRHAPARRSNGSSPGDVITLHAVGKGSVKGNGFSVIIEEEEKSLTPADAPAETNV